MLTREDVVLAARLRDGAAHATRKAIALAALLIDACAIDTDAESVNARACPHAPACAYCDQPLSKRHEHDHFPPLRGTGGSGTVCMCINCDDLKDRTTIDAMDASHVLAAFASLWSSCSATQRILIADIVALMTDARGAPRG